MFKIVPSSMRRSEIKVFCLCSPPNVVFLLFYAVQPLGKGLLQRLLFNLCAHSVTRAILVYLLLDMIKSEAEGSAGGVATINSHRLYGCQSNVVYGRSQLLDGSTFFTQVLSHFVITIFTLFMYLNRSSSSGVASYS